MLQILRQHGEKVRQAYVLRRIMKSDRDLVQYVLAVETGPFVFRKQAWPL